MPSGAPAMLRRLLVPRVVVVTRRLAPTSSAALPPGASVFPDFLSVAEHDELVEVVEKRLKRRRYERDHWDSVIVNYRESEVADRFLGGGAWLAVSRARALLAEEHGCAAFLPAHAIDLAADGAITPHVDSVKFSGGVVAGLSLLSPATLALGAADPATGEEITGGARYEARLAPRSLYVLAGEARYAYAHAIGGLDGRRLSLILRDARPPD